MQRDRRADGDRPRVVVPRFDLHLEQIPVLIKRPRNRVRKVVRRVITYVDKVVWTHHGGERSIYAAKQGQRNGRALVAWLASQLRDQRFLEVEEFARTYFSGHGR